MKATTGIGINPGAMRDQVVIEEQATQQDAFGQPLAQWNHVLTARAEVLRKPGREIWASAQRNGRVPTQFKLRFFDGIESRMRLTLNTSTVYNIISAVDPDGLRAELIVTAEQLVEEAP